MLYIGCFTKESRSKEKGKRENSMWIYSSIGNSNGWSILGLINGFKLPYAFFLLFFHLKTIFLDNQKESTLIYELTLKD